MWKLVSYIILSASCFAQVVIPIDSHLEWQVGFEYSPDMAFTNVTELPITVQVPFEYDSGFIRIVPRKVEVTDMKKLLLAALVALGAESDGRQVIIPALISNVGEVAPVSPVVPDGLYPDLWVYEPANVDWTSFTAFDVPVTNTASTAVIAEWTRTADAGEAIMYSSEETITNFIVYSQGSTNDVTPTDYTYYGAATLPSTTMMMLWPDYGSTGTPIRVNSTEAWFVAPATASIGDTIRVFGRNLGSDCKLWNEGREEWLNPVSCNGYMATYTVPASWSNGSHTLYAHNGQGRKYGFALPLSLTVVSATDWGGGTQRNVGAFTLAAIQSAISAASNGDTIYFQNGTYNITGGINCGGKKLRLKGQSSSAVIQATSGWSGNYLLYGLANGSEINTIKLNSNDYFENNGAEQILRIPNIDNVTITNVVFSELDITDGAYAYNSFVNVTGCENLKFIDCTFILKDLVDFSDAYDVTIDGCSFRGLWDANKMTRINGAKNFVLVDSDFDHYDNSDSTSGHYWAQGRWLNNDNHPQHNLAIVGNTATNMTRRMWSYDKAWWSAGTNWYAAVSNGPQNTGECYMFEGANVEYQNTPSSATSNTVVFTGESASFAGQLDWTVQIVGGKGMGQTRAISQISGDTITVSENWNVIPDSNSTVLLGDMTYRLVGAYNNFYGTAFNEVSDYGSAFRNNANAGFQPYDSSAADWVIANNHFSQYRFPVRFYSRFEATVSGDPTYHAGGVYFNDVRNNNFVDCFNVVQYVSDDKDAGTGYTSITNYMGNSIVGNTVTNLTGQMVSYSIDGDVSAAVTKARGVMAGNIMSVGTSNLTSFVSGEWVTVGNSNNAVAWP